MTDTTQKNPSPHGQPQEPSPEEDVVAEIRAMVLASQQELFEKMDVKNLEELKDLISSDRKKILGRILEHMRIKKAPGAISREEWANRLDVVKVEGANMNLRPNQLKAVRQLIEFLRNTEGDRGYFIQPTGAGKTFLFGLICKLLNVPTIILVPTSNLVTQSMRELKESLGFKKNEIGIIESNKPVPQGKRVVVGTYQSHVSRMKTPKEKVDWGYRDLVNASPLLICDEAHRSLGSATQKAIGALDASEEEEMPSDEEIKYQEEALRNIDTTTAKNTLKLGFTATADLAQKNVGSYFETLIARETHENMVEAGFLVPYQIHSVKGVVEPGQITEHTTTHEEGEFLRSQQMYEALVEKWLKTRDGLKSDNNPTPFRTAVFCANIEECDAFAKIANEKGLRTRVITTREKGGNRKQGGKLVQEAEQELLAGKIDMIITVNMLTEGWDCRPINAIVLARATRSAAKIIQAAGRGARAQKDHEKALYGEKKECHIFEGLFQLSTRTQQGANIGPTMRRGAGGGVPKELSGTGEPFTLADALATVEDHAQKIVHDEEGKSVACREVVHLDDHTGIGELKVDGKTREAVWLSHYLQNFPHVDEEKIRRYKPDIKSVLLNGTRVKCGEVLPEGIFLKDEVDAAISAIYHAEIHFNEEGVGLVMDSVEPHEAAAIPTFKWVELVDLEVYLENKQKGGDIRTILFNKGIFPFHLRKEKLFGPQGNEFWKFVYRKEDIDAVLAPLASNAPEEEKGGAKRLTIIPGPPNDPHYATLIWDGEGYPLRVGGNFNIALEILNRIMEKAKNLDENTLAQLKDWLSHYNDALMDYEGRTHWAGRFVDQLSEKIYEITEVITKQMPLKSEVA